MRITFPALAERLQTTLWFIPALFALGALIAATVFVAVDRQLQEGTTAFFVYAGTPEGARSMLSTIAQSMLTFTGLVFTVTMLVLQLASSQLSPRVLRTFLSDRKSQIVLGLFVATFLYTLVVLRDVRGERDGGEAFVPGLAVWMSFVLLLASVAAFIYYINHMAHAIRASTVIANIASETRAALDRRYPRAEGDSGANPTSSNEIVATFAGDERWLPIDSDSSGFLVDVDHNDLQEIAESADIWIHVVPRVGDYVVQSTPVALVSAEPGDGAADRIRGTLSFGPERSMRHDPAFGFRQLVDVGVRALSPGTNDPSTAAHVVQRLHDLLADLARRPMPSRSREDDDGQARVQIAVWTWDDYVRLATEELTLYGRGHVQVTKALESMLSSLASSVPEDRRISVYTALNQLRSSGDPDVA